MYMYLARANEQCAIMRRCAALGAHRLAFAGRAWVRASALTAHRTPHVPEYPSACAAARAIVRSGQFGISSHTKSSPCQVPSVLQRRYVDPDFVRYVESLHAELQTEPAVTPPLQLVLVDLALLAANSDMTLGHVGFTSQTSGVFAQAPSEPHARVASPLFLWWVARHRRVQDAEPTKASVHTPD